jgi:5-methylcytosine-specific restriction protein B
VLRGVGKTYMAKRLAYSLMECKDDNRIEFIQFHQSYSYEDFVEGIRPDKNGRFKLQKGIFYEFCKKAEENEEEDYYLIIDEINRGNLSKIFGELLTLMEGDKRDEEVELVYSHELFSIPSNIYIIGCMNTADRSLALIDYALRRRFAFINIEPAFENEQFIKDMNKYFKEKAQTIIDTMKEINEDIKKDTSLGKGFMIGHSYFCNKELSDLPIIIEHEIIPLFEEYWYDDETALKEYTNKMNGVLND